MLMTAPRAPFNHPRQIAAHEIDRRLDQHPELSQFPLWPGCRERLTDAVARVVDQDLHPDPELI
jgi:hypothetical protein